MPPGLRSSTVAVVAANPPQQVILVADVGVDDAAGVLPVLALSRRDELEVLGIAATPSAVEVTSTRNAERLLLQLPTEVPCARLPWRAVSVRQHRLDAR